MLPDPSELADRLHRVRGRIAAAAPRGVVPEEALLAVGKTRPAAALRALAVAGQRRFGENYVQEAVAKQADLADLDLEWHLIGPLQSNKCALAARHFDWVQSIDRAKLPALLARARPPQRTPLNLLIQVNVDDEASKSGCTPESVDALAAEIARHPALRLRGLMAIPAPWPDPERRVAAFRRMRALFDALRSAHSQVDTLSMGMSDDFEAALREGATLVRIGTSLFGPREARRGH